ncbi:AtpZ/AtpI family protein [Polycladidibacter hongkongensis]|uniref:AtpZ/AtpI family protein n=1 Tax=Polycladidibacter hongkongensis TaxID=1647556 RepID=UPI00082F29AB|nr:AtpZ/AtpI family protein [Pseudovibrio hongkongensis]
MTSKDDQRKAQKQANSESELSERLNKLDTALDAYSAAQAPKKKQEGAMTGLSQGWKMSSEFIAGVLVGGVIGWTFDSWLDTKPWGLIVFLLLGFAAGVLNVLREAGKMAQPVHRQDKSADRKD